MATTLLPNNNGTHTPPTAITDPLLEGPNRTSSTSGSSAPLGVGGTPNTLESHPDKDKDPAKNKPKEESVGFWGAIGNFFCAIGRAIALFFCWLFCIKTKPTEIDINDKNLLLQNLGPVKDPKIEIQFIIDAALMEKFLKIEGTEDKLLPKELAKLVLTMLEGIRTAPVNREKAGVWNGGASEWMAIAAAYKKLQELKADPIHHLAFALTNGLDQLTAIAAIEGRLDNYIGTRAPSGEQKYTEGTLGRVLDSATKGADDAHKKEALKETWEGFFQLLNLDPAQKAPGKEKSLQQLIDERDWNSLVKDLIALRTLITAAPYPFKQTPKVPVAGGVAATSNSPKAPAELPPGEATQLTAFFLADEPLGRIRALGFSSGLLSNFVEGSSPLKDIQPLRAWRHLLLNEETRGKLIVLANLRNGKFTERLNLVREKIAPHQEQYAQEHAAEFCQKVGISHELTEFAIRSRNWSGVIFEALSKVPNSKIDSPFTALNLYPKQLAAALLSNQQCEAPPRVLSALTPAVAWVDLLKQETFVAHLKELRSDKVAGKLETFCIQLKQALQNGSATPGHTELEQVCKELGLSSRNISSWGDIAIAFLDKQAAAEAAAQ